MDFAIGQKGEMMNDSLVSRQAVKDIMFNIRTNRYNNDKHFAELCLEEFDAIPSTQPEIKTDGDMISRQQTIDALMQEFKRIPTNSIRAKIVVENLPSAQPETNCSEFPNGSDTISRQAAIDAICAVCGNDCDKSEFVYNAPQDEQVILCPEHYCLCNLPSAQPERTKRIIGKSRDGMTMWYQCESCNEPVDEKDLFCSGCGRRFEDG